MVISDRFHWYAKKHSCSKALTNLDANAIHINQFSFKVDR